jgi:O-antigen ligase
MLKFVFGVVLIGLGFACALLLEPVWGLYLFSALTHIRLEQLGESYTLPLRVPIVIGVLTLLLYLFSSKYPQKLRRWPAEVWLFALMILGMALSSAHAIFAPDLAWAMTFDYIKYWVFMVLLIQMLDTRKRLDGFYWTMVLSAAWLVYRAWDLRGTTGERFENIGGGSISDSNHYAAALVLLFPFVYHRTLSSDRRIAIGAAVLCFGVVMAMIIANSRGAFLGTITLAVLILLCIKKGRTRNVVALVLLGVLGVFFAKQSQLDRLMSVVGAASGEARDNSAALRLVFWGLAWELFKDHPLLGVGPANFPYYSGTMLEGLPYGQAGHVTHSLWFEMLSQGGLLVTVPFVLMLLRFFYNSQRLARHYMAAGQEDIAMYIYVPMFGLAGLMVASSFLDRMTYEPIFWCIGLGAVHRYLWANEAKVVGVAAERANTAARATVPPVSTIRKRV